MSILSDYYKHSRQRAEKRKNPWNIFLFIFAVAGMGASWWGSALAVFALQSRFIPNETILAGRSEMAMTLISVSLFFPSLIFGMMFSNTLAWCIPQARATLDNSVIIGASQNYVKSMRAVFRIYVFMVLFTIPFVLVGALNYFYVTDQGVHLNRFLSLRERYISWDDIHAIQTRCYAERSNLHLNYVLKTIQGDKVDLLSVGPADFLNAYQELVPMLKRSGVVKFESQVSSLGMDRLRLRYPQSANDLLVVLEGADFMENVVIETRNYQKPE